jgi:hypothetical protein
MRTEKPEKNKNDIPFRRIVANTISAVAIACRRLASTRTIVPTLVPAVFSAVVPSVLSSLVSPFLSALVAVTSVVVISSFSAVFSELSVVATKVASPKVAAKVAASVAPVLVVLVTWIASVLASIVASEFATPALAFVVVIAAAIAIPVSVIVMIRRSSHSRIWEIVAVASWIRTIIVAVIIPTVEIVSPSTVHGSKSPIEKSSTLRINATRKKTTTSLGTCQNFHVTGVVVN